MYVYEITVIFARSPYSDRINSISNFRKPPTERTNSIEMGGEGRKITRIIRMSGQEKVCKEKKRSKKRLRRRINLKKKIKIDDEAAYKNGDARDKNSTNTYVKIEVRYRGYKLTTLFHPSLPLPLLFYLPLPSRPSIVSSRYLPTNFAFKAPRDIPLFSSSTIWICPSQDRDRRCNTIPLFFLPFFECIEGTEDSSPLTECQD